MGGSAAAIDSGGTTGSRERLRRKSQLVTSRRSGLVVERRARDVGAAVACGSDQRQVTHSGGIQAVGKRRKRQNIVSHTSKKRKEISQQKEISSDRVKTASQASSVSDGCEGRDSGGWEVIDKWDISLDNQSYVQTAPSCNLETVSMELTCSTEHQSQHGADSREVHRDTG